MPSLHCLFLLQAVEASGTMRPRSLTESHGTITVYIMYLYNKAEVTNASFSHSVSVSRIYLLKCPSFSRVALGLLGRQDKLLLRLKAVMNAECLKSHYWTRYIE